MPQRTYHYTAFRPMGPDRKIVHLRCDEERATYRWISIEQSRRGLCVIGVSYAPDDALHLEARSLDEESVKRLVADHNHGGDTEAKDIEIELHPSLNVTVTGDGEPSRPLTRRLGYGSRFNPIHPNPFTDEPVGNRWDKISRPIPPPFEDHDHESE